MKNPFQKRMDFRLWIFSIVVQQYTFLFGQFGTILRIICNMPNKFSMACICIIEFESFPHKSISKALEYVQKLRGLIFPNFAPHPTRTDKSNGHFTDHLPFVTWPIMDFRWPPPPYSWPRCLMTPYFKMSLVVSRNAIVRTFWKMWRKSLVHKDI